MYRDQARIHAALSQNFDNTPVNPSLVSGLVERAVDLVYRYRLIEPVGFEYVSPSSTAIVGYTPEEHYADPELGFKLVHPEDLAILEAIRTTPPNGEPVRLRWVRKDGRTVCTEQRNVGVYDEGGTLVAIEGIAREIFEPEDGVVRFGDLVLEPAAMRAVVAGRSVRLTPSELRLLLALGRAARPVSREELVEAVWESSVAGPSRTFDTHVAHLRRKLEEEPRHPQRLVTIRGVGYELRAR